MGRRQAARKVLLSNPFAMKEDAYDQESFRRLRSAFRKRAKGWAALTRQRRKRRSAFARWNTSSTKRAEVSHSHAGRLRLRGWNHRQKHGRRMILVVENYVCRFDHSRSARLLFASI